MKPIEQRHRLALLYDIRQLCLYGDSKTVICDWMLYGAVPANLVADDNLDHVQALLRELVRRDDPALQLCDEHQAAVDRLRRRAGIHVPASRDGWAPGWLDKVYGQRGDTIRRLLG